MSLILEIQRWRALVPLGIPHVSTEEVIYKGYRIPKGSIILGNSLGILHDEQAFKDAHLFKPNRYLTLDGKSIDKSVMEPSVAIFGYGRRVCPGRYVAEASIWIILSSLIAAFNFHHVDETGGPDHEFQIGLLRVPNEFRARFEPRSEAIQTLIEKFKRS
ncbi:cytochrome P450 [Panaeolus papilionaceus]|nr:cytochrome P450 [Panaeolus papilionaceus]